jgi:hypothetical protein
VVLVLNIKHEHVYFINVMHFESYIRNLIKVILGDFTSLEYELLAPVVSLITSRQILEWNHNLGYFSFSLENPFFTVMQLYGIIKYMNGKVLLKLTQR